MDRKLKILHLEDMQSDAEMVSRELKKAHILFDVIVVDNRNDFIHALNDFIPDVIISDHSLPSFNSQEALRIVKQMNIATPFILVTATVSEEYAVNIMREGASDYILKDRLQRLPNAITNALSNYNLEIERRKAIENLRLSEQKYKLLFEGSPMPMWIECKSTFNILDVNEAAIGHYGYTRAEFLELNVSDIMVAEDNWKPDAISPHKKKDGTLIMVDILANDIIYEGISAKIILAHDVTEKLAVEAELARQLVLRQKLVTETSIKVQERERKEIGEELHDNINQILAATQLYLGLAIENNNTQSPELLVKSYQNVELAIQQIRQLSQTLVAPSLGNISLGEAIKNLIDNIRLASPLKFELKIKQYNEHLIDNNIKLTLYRITQEQINNIIKHAKASHVSIALSTIADEILLKIEDDGIGFDTKKTSGGIGLRNMTNRAELYNGRISIISGPAQGCKLQVTIPVRAEENYETSPLKKSA